MKMKPRLGRRNSFAVLVALVVLGVGARVASCETYGGGSGTAEDPYLISTPEQMNAIGANPDDWGNYFLLTADIDLSGYTGTEFNIIGTNYSNPFTGVFDGNGHTISNFTYDSNGVNSIGLFGYINDSNAEIKNLGLIDPNVNAGTGDDVGSLVGWLRNGTINDCNSVGGSVSGYNYVGGLVGRNYGTVSNSYATTSVSGNNVVGGLVGYNNGTVSNTYAVGDVNGVTDVGGLVGSSTTEVFNSYFLNTAGPIRTPKAIA